MTGAHNYQLVTKAATGIFGVLAFGIWASKNFKSILAQIQDTQADEAVGLITLAATQELPKLWAAFQAPAEQPLV
jgi:hypothetical protein